jgi:hypothetical protein
VRNLLGRLLGYRRCERCHETFLGKKPEDLHAIEVCHGSGWTGLCSRCWHRMTRDEHDEWVRGAVAQHIARSLSDRPTCPHLTVDDALACLAQRVEPPLCHRGLIG